METLDINYLAIGVCGVLSMVVGAVWYGPLFGRVWMNIVGVSPDDEAKRKEMQKGAGPLYGVQLLLTLFQVLVLAHLIADTSRVSGVERSLWIWGAFVMPTLAGASMWTMDSRKIKWARFGIQSGYQLVMFGIYGTILYLWE